ncbi:hypothetical protein ACJIZ3_022962 [Penstemon smallii]|uniref:Enhancer of polycomb-like protein n=1 Tax=Penstemon smallii TaxID=265156 RepID=A0ABD3TMS1_9LAMI
MPSVGMRRSTRVFGARVLRSGRRLWWTEPREGTKYMRAAAVQNDWIDLLDNSADGGGDADHRLKNVQQESEGADIEEPRIEERASEGVVEVKDVNRMYGIVYKRKRKRAELTSTELSEDKRFGKKFVRKQWRKKNSVAEPLEVCGDRGRSVVKELAIVAYDSSSDSSYWITCFLTSVLRYMTKVRLRIRRLSAFVHSGPIFGAYYSHGVLFRQDSVTDKTPGVCIISGTRSSVPVFVVDFSAIPSCFMHIYRIMLLRAAHNITFLLVSHSSGLYERDAEVMDVVDDSGEPSSPIEFIADSSQISWGEITSGNDDFGRREFSNSAVSSPKSALRSMQLRSSRKIQKRRRFSLSRKKGRPSAAFRAQKASGSLVSEFIRIRHDTNQLSTAAPSRVLRSSNKMISNPDAKQRVLRSSIKKFSNPDVKELNSTSGLLTQDMCVSSCSVNLLIIETDKCYREEGAIITLQQSASKQWFLALTKNGVQRNTLIAQKVMKPPSFNRFTHATVWSGDGGFKLEFPNKQDWLIFKQLYKECSDRNLQASGDSVIPVPKVVEVSSSVDSKNASYVRPDSYITYRDDELTRALARKSATYDMESDDEDWLNKFNEEREVQKVITPEKFELIIDALEKSFHCNADEYSDEFCMHIESKEVIEAIRSYWIKKQKQKRSALVRIFQLYQPRRPQVIPKSVLRKKRSFKRQASHPGRGKQHTFFAACHASRGKQQPLLQAIASERDSLEQRNNNSQKVEKAKAVAGRSEGLAVLKRQRAQMLMENADLATYKATIALRIAEAAQNGTTVPSIFLG